ncbi:MAG TPA: hypothetical protein VIU12_01040, partial [Chryseolinea sp.]
NGHKLQNLIYQLALGFIVSLMFYYILVFHEEIKERKATEIFLAHELRNHLREIAVYVHAMWANKINHYAPSQTEYPSREWFFELCSFWKPQHNGHIFYANFNRGATMWERLQVLLQHWESMQTRIALRMRTPDPEMKMLLSRIDQCSFVVLLRTVGKVQDPGSNLLEIHASSFWDFIELNKELSEYCHEKYATLLLRQYFKDKE